jgi:acyl-CoA hydrolase
MALSSQAGTVSRIVPRLSGGTTAVARADVDTIVTEHGVAVLRDLDTEARARALIAIAAPEHRGALEQAWHTLKSSPTA